MKRVLSLDIKYALTQVLYFGSFCGLMGYASVYLLSKGVSNSLIGIILALVSVFSVFTQPALASFADKNKHIELRTIINSFLVVITVLSIILYMMGSVIPVILCLFVGIATLMTTLQPLLNSLAFEFEKYGIEINYGIARGLGSAAYALVSLGLGYLVEDFGPNQIPLVYIILNAIFIIVVYTYVVPKNQRIEVQTQQHNEVEEGKQLTILQFCQTYKKFMVFIFGVVFVFFTHTIINNFFIQVIRPIHGTESHMGIAVFIAAIVELPAMGMFNIIRKKIDCTTLIKISVIMFAVKHAITFFATNMTLIYIAQFTQIAAYAIFIPASVYYVNEIIKKEDVIKGQSMVPMAMTGSGILANLIGGMLIDSIGVHNVLLIGVIISIVGAIIVIMSVEKKKIVKNS